MVVSVAGKLQHPWPEKAAGEKQQNNLGGGAGLDPAKKPDADAPVTSPFGLKNVAANVPANMEEKLEPVFAKIELKHAWNESNDAVLGVKKDFSTNKEVPAFKVPLKRVSLEPKVAPPVAMEPAKRSSHPEPSNSFKVDLKKSAPPKEASSESKIATPATDLKKTSSIVRPSISAPVEQPVYKKEFDLAKAEATATRPSLSTSAHNEKPLFKVDLKKTSSIVRPSITAQVEQPVYKKEFDLAKAEAASAKPNHSTRSANNEEPLFKVDLKKTSSIVRPSITVREEKPVYKKEFDLAKAEAAATRPNLNTSQEPSFKVGLTHVGPVEKPAANEFSEKMEPAFNLTLNKKVDDHAPPAANMSGESSETGPFKLPLKKVETAEKPVTEDSDHNKEPLFKVDLKKTSSVVRPSITAQVEQPVYKKEFDLAKAEAAAAKSNLTTSQEPSFKVGLKHVAPVEMPVTNEVTHKKESFVDSTLKKVDDHAPPAGDTSERPAEAGLFNVPLKKVETAEKPIAHAEEPVFNLDLKKAPSIVRPSITAQVEQPVYKKAFDLAKAEAAAVKPNLNTSQEPSFKVGLKHVEPEDKPAANALSEKMEPAFNLTLKKKVDDPTHPAAEPAENEKNNVLTKKVETTEKPVFSDPLQKDEPLFKVDLKKTSSIVRPSNTAPMEHPVYKKTFDLAKAEAAAAKPNLTSSQEPSFKVGLRHVGPVEKAPTNVVIDTEAAASDSTFNKNDAITGDNADQPTSPAPLRKVSISPKISGDVNDKASLADGSPNSRSSSLVPKFVQAGEHTNASSSVINSRRSSAQNELGALRALGLTKAISTKGLESNYDAASKKKEDEELEALRIRGLATFKMVDPALNPSADTPAAVAEQRSKAEEELTELRSKGLATTFSNNEAPSVQQKVDVGPSVSCGLTKAQEEKAIAKPDEISAERLHGETGITSPATDRSHSVLESDGEDGMFLDTDDESGALVILPEPDTDEEEQAGEDAHEDTPASDDKDASAPPEAATNLDTPGKLEKKKSKKSFEESTPTFTPEEKAALRRQRRESKEQFKGIKRFIFGKKGVKSAE